jgi:hypothetical protein
VRFQNLKTNRRRGKIPPDNNVARPYLITIYLTALVKDRFRLGFHSLGEGRVNPRKLADRQNNSRGPPLLAALVLDC